MEKLKDGGPAFPGPDQMETETDIHEGMSLRDYLAAKAMQGFATGAEGLGSAKAEFVREQFDMVACFAYMMADAMLRARES